jgi:CBS domain-containing protein
MDNPIKPPEEILAYRSLRRILASKPKALWTVAPADSVLTAMQIMADKNIGFLVVMERDAIAGVVSERDCARRVVLRKQSAETTLVADIMVRNVITIDAGHTFADCLRLMHQHGIRHLPVVENGKVIAVVSIRDLLSEAVRHNAKIIEKLQLERMTAFTSTA